MEKINKPKVGIFSMTCCEGCQLEILNLEDVILDIVDKIDIISFRLAKAEDINQDFDIVFLEGSVSSEEDKEKAIKLRERSKVLISLGSCACTGGVQSFKKFMNKKDSKLVEKSVYTPKNPDTGILNEAYGVHEIVDVDFKIRGCPIDTDEFVELLKEFLLGKKPYLREWPVCVECKLNENPCLLDEGKICLGPVTYGGCNSVCPNNAQYCIGCRGIMDDANISAHVKLLKSQGHKITEIKEAFQTIFGKHPRLKEVK
jgi:sulfhydrogenase subunit delta